MAVAGALDERHMRLRRQTHHLAPVASRLGQEERETERRLARRARQNGRTRAEERVAGEEIIEEERGGEERTEERDLGLARAIVPRVGCDARVPIVDGRKGGAMWRGVDET